MIKLAQLLKLWPFGGWGAYKVTQNTILVVYICYGLKYAQSKMHLKLCQDLRFVRVSYLTSKQQNSEARPNHYIIQSRCHVPMLKTKLRGP